MKSPEAERERLAEILCLRSVRFGDFVLASGERSHVYIDCKPTTMAPEAMRLVGRLFLRQMEEGGWRPEAVGGLTLGADPIAFAVARESLETGRPIQAFVIRKEAKKHGTQRYIEGMDEPAGRPVVIVEDVCTKGGSTAVAIERAQEAGMKVLGAICLVDREMGGGQLLRQRFGIELRRIFTLSELLAAGAGIASAAAPANRSE